MSRQTVDVFVVTGSRTSPNFYAYSNVIPRDVSIHRQFLPRGINPIGRWFRVTIGSQNSACERATLIADLFESRVVNGFAEIKVTAIHDGRFENKCERFHHEYFGYICDLPHIIKQVDEDGIYQFWITRLLEQNANCRWRLSRNQRSFGPYGSTTNLCISRKIEAIVYNACPENKMFYAWSKSDPKKVVLIPLSILNSTKDLLGLWIEVEVDSNNRAKKEPVVIRDVFETRVNCGVVEIRIDFEVGRTPGFMFSNYFGIISDLHKKITEHEENAWYEGWIKYYPESDVDSRWHLLKNQKVLGPYVIPNSAPLEIPKPKQEEPIKYLNRHVNNPALMNVYGRREPRSPSPKNIRPKTNVENSQKSNQGFRFDAKRKWNVNQKKNEQPKNQPKTQLKNQPKNPPKNGLFDNNAFEFDSRFQEHNLHQKDHNSKSNGIDNFLLNNEEPPPTPNPANDTRLNQEMNELNIRRNELPRSVDSTIRATPDSGRFTYSENENEDQHHVHTQHSKNPFSELDKNSVGKKRIDALTKSDRNVNSKIATTAQKSEMTEEEKEIIRLKSKIGQVSRLVLSLTEDQHISQRMKLFGLEEYEELMKLVTS